MSKEKKLNETKKMLARFDELWNEEAKNKIYKHSIELSNLASSLHSKKLNDEFLLEDLSSEENEILTKALIIANL